MTRKSLGIGTRADQNQNTAERNPANGTTAECIRSLGIITLTNTAIKVNIIFSADVKKATNLFAH